MICEALSMQTFSLQFSLCQFNYILHFLLHTVITLKNAIN